MTIEYRVKPVTRYIVTRHEHPTEPEFARGATGSTRQIGGEHDNPEVAYQVGYALARQEQENLGLLPGDMGVIFPEHPGEVIIAKKPKYALDQLLAEGQMQDD